MSNSYGSTAAAIAHWDGETLELGHGLTLIRGGGHFPGGAMLHRAHDGGELLTGDIIQVIPDRSHVGFMWSYPNLIPLDEHTVLDIAHRVQNFRFNRVYGGWWGRVVIDDGAGAIRRSADRYLARLHGERPPGAGGGPR